MSTSRILIFTHDGRGMGHLRRLSLVAAELQKEASVLFITGLREACWLVPSQCEFVHLPARDSLDSTLSRQWHRDPFIDEDSEIARALRPNILKTVIDSYKPDVLIVDYLPLGMGDELQELVFGYPACRKYFICRGVLGNPQEIRSQVFTPNCLDALRNEFCRILVMSDSRVIDTVKEYGFDDILSSKTTYTGYAVKLPSPSQIKAFREARLIPSGSRWIVCSAGGGKTGEELIQRCWELSRYFPEHFFDIVVGPRSRITLINHYRSNGRVAVVESNIKSLPMMHAAADVVITRGGYNSLLEACVGSANMIVVPLPNDFEQEDHSRRLSDFRKLTYVEDLDNLEAELAGSVHLGGQMPLTGETLKLNGARRAAQIILNDLRPGYDESLANQVHDWSLVQ